MAMRRYHKALVLVLTLVASLALVLGAAGPVVANQNAPSWGTGNQWTFNVTGGSETSDQWVVMEQTSLTIAGKTYSVWHAQEHVTTVSGSSTTTTTANYWITVSGLAIAQSFISLQVPFLGYINTTVTYDPPRPLVEFPLYAGFSWSGSTNVTTKINANVITVTNGYTGQVLGEASVTVPAGTFTAAQVREPATGNPYKIYSYSDAAGFFVKIQNFDSSGNPTTTETLTSYSYTGALLLWIVIGIVVLAVIAVVGLLFLRRRRGPRAPAYPAQYPPQQPPQQPPLAPPPGGP